MAELRQRQYRIIFLGEPGVGKTTTSLRVKCGEFINTQECGEMARGGDAVFYETTVDGEALKVCIHSHHCLAAFFNSTSRV